MRRQQTADDLRSCRSLPTVEFHFVDNLQMVALQPDGTERRYDLVEVLVFDDDYISAKIVWRRNVYGRGALPWEGFTLTDAQLEEWKSEEQSR